MCVCVSDLDRLFFLFSSLFSYLLRGGWKNRGDWKELELASVEVDLTVVRSNEDRSLLHAAARCGQVLCIRWLVKLGIDVDIRDRHNFHVGSFSARTKRNECDQDIDHLNLCRSPPFPTPLPPLSRCPVTKPS